MEVFILGGGGHTKHNAETQKEDTRGKTKQEGQEPCLNYRRLSYLSSLWCIWDLFLHPDCVKEGERGNDNTRQREREREREISRGVWNFDYISRLNYSASCGRKKECFYTCSFHQELCPCTQSRSNEAVVTYDGSHAVPFVGCIDSMTIPDPLPWRERKASEHV